MAIKSNDSASQSRSEDLDVGLALEGLGLLSFRD